MQIDLKPPKEMLRFVDCYKLRATYYSCASLTLSTSSDFTLVHGLVVTASAS